MRVLRKIMALTLALTLVLSMGAMTAFAAEEVEWLSPNQKDVVDHPTAEITINSGGKTNTRVYYKATDAGHVDEGTEIISAETKSGKRIRFEWKGGMRVNDYECMYIDVINEGKPFDNGSNSKRWTTEDVGTIKTKAKIVFSDGTTVIDDINFELVITDRPSVDFALYEVGADLNEDDPIGDTPLIAGKTYNAVTYFADRAGRGQTVGAPVWTTKLNGSPVSAAGKTTGSQLPESSDWMWETPITFTGGGEAELQVAVEYSDKNGHGTTRYGSQYYVAANQDIILDQNDGVYPGQKLSVNVSINKNNIWSGYDFKSTKGIKSVAMNPATTAEAKFSARFDMVESYGEESENFPYMGFVEIKVQDNDDTTTEWEEKDFENTVESKLVVTFEDNTKATFPIKEKINDRAFIDLEDDAYQEVKYYSSDADQSKNTYTYTAKLNDLNGKVSGTPTYTQWEVDSGTTIAAIEKDNVIIGTDNKATNKLTVSGRGRVYLKIIDEFSHKDYYVENPRERGRRSIGINVKGDAAPLAIGVSSINTEAPDKVTLKVPNNNKLDEAGLKDIIAAAKTNNNAPTVELELDRGIKMAIGISGLTDDFIKSGFDPLVIPAAPAAVSKTDIRTDKGQWLDFAHEGALPGKTTVTVPMYDFEEDPIFAADDKPTMWQWKDGKLVKGTDATATFDGANLIVDLMHCSVWAAYPEGYNPNTDTWGKNDNNNNNNNNGDSSSGGSSSSAPSYPTADKGLEGLAKIKDLTPANLPLNAKLTKTAAGKDIAVIPVTLINGSMGVTDLNLLGKLGATVGLEIKQTGLDIIIPGGFGIVNDPGRFAYPLAYNKVAENKAAMLAAVKGEGALSFTCTIGGNVTLPTIATMTLTTDIKKDGDVNVYRYDTATGKLVFVAKSKIAGGKVIFATKQLGQFLVTTGTL